MGKNWNQIIKKPEVKAEEKKAEVKPAKKAEVKPESKKETAGE